MSLWMRYVEFGKLKDLLHLVFQNNGKLRPIELEKLGIEKRVLLKQNGLPFGHSARYHYRKVMEGLGLVVKNKVYYVSTDARVVSFLKLTKFKEIMSEQAKEVLRDIIVRNTDCRKYFFDIFLNRNSYTLADLRKEGSYGIIETESMRKKAGSVPKRNEIKTNKEKRKKRVGTIIIKSSIGKTLVLNTQDLVQSVYWGVRLWALDLEIMDEILLNYAEGRIIYPINREFSEETLRNLLTKKIKMGMSDSSEWVTLHLPSFIKEVALLTRFPVNKIKRFLIELKLRYPYLVTYIPCSTMFIDIKTPFEKQESTIRKLYLYSKDKGFISHLRINVAFLKEVNHE